MTPRQPGQRATRATYRVNVREIAEALNIEVLPHQWVVIEDAEEDGEITGSWVDIVVWEREQ